MPVSRAVAERRGTVSPVASRRAASRDAYRTRKGPLRVLGVSAHYHDSAAALVVDGEVVAAVQEERFSRVKHDASFPRRSIEWVLEAGDVAPSALTAVVFYESPFAKFDRILATQSTGRLSGALQFARSVSGTFPAKMRVAQECRELLGRSVPVHLGDHHLSHAASAFLPSPFEEAAILTVDAVGEWTTTSLGVGRGSSVRLLEQVEYPNSLGLLYSAFTAYCGFRPNSGEYKLMGLAPYGDPSSASVLADLVLRELLHLSDDGSFALNPRFFDFVSRARAYNPTFEALLGGPTREESDPLLQRHADVALAAQEVLGRAVLGLAHRAHRVTGCRNLCMAGGVALNVTANSLLAEEGPFDGLWVQPAAGDAGGALGAALWFSHEVCGVPRPSPVADRMRGALLGPAPGSPEEIEAAVTSAGLVFERLEEDAAADRVASVLESGGIVGVARGPMEFGPRALGCRSVLADPRVPGMQRRLNLRTKLREGFRPFAPAVTAEAASVWFDLDVASAYMLRTFPVRGWVAAAAVDPGDWSSRLASVGGPLPAVTHVDGSARVQTVEQDVNPGLHALLEAFARRTGCPVLVNTSFNVRGEPIVRTAREAVEAFLRMGLDALLVGDLLVLREGQDPAVLAAAVPRIEGTD